MQRHCLLRQPHHKLAEPLAATSIVGNYSRARSVRLVLREKVGRDDGRGRDSLGFALWEMRGHAESIDALDVIPEVEPDVEPDNRCDC
jgi:hypothetical protein